MIPRGDRRVAKKSLKKSKIELKWNFTMKHVVFILFSDFNFSGKFTARIFNVVFEDHIKLCGFVQDVPLDRLRSQWGERKKAHRDWIRILRHNASDEANREALKAKIQTVARQLSQADRATVSPLTPLSRRAPIACWQGDDEYQPDEPRSCREQNRETAERPQGLLTPKRTPKKKAKAIIPKIAETRNDGTVVMVSPNKRSAQIVESVPESMAHPPLNGLLFRYYNEDLANDLNSDQGFWARKYYRSNVIHRFVPRSTELDMTDIFNHMDRKMEKSPFISTSNRLVWIFQLALKGLESGDLNGRIAIINTHALDKRTVFYAKPFHDAISKVRAWSNGAWRYPGTSEYLVWRQIPGEALIHTVKVADLLHLAQSVSSIAEALRIDILRQSGPSLQRTKIPRLRAGNIPLTARLTTGIAELCIFFGLHSRSRIEQLSHVVSDVLQGWGLAVSLREDSEWLQLADVFLQHLVQRAAPAASDASARTRTPTGSSAAPPPPLTLKERFKVKQAFLEGVKWSCGDFNAKLKPALLARLERKAASVGLQSPAELLRREMLSVSFALVSHERMQEHALAEYHRQKLAQAGAAPQSRDLLAGGGAGSEAMDLDVGGVLGPFTQAGEREDDGGDEDEDEDDEGWRVTFDEDGDMYEL